MLRISKQDQILFNDFHKYNDLAQETINKATKTENNI